MIGPIESIKAMEDFVSYISRSVEGIEVSKSGHKTAKGLDSIVIMNLKPSPNREVAGNEHNGPLKDRENVSTKVIFQKRLKEEGQERVLATTHLNLLTHISSYDAVIRAARLYGSILNWMEIKGEKETARHEYTRDSFPQVRYWIKD